MNLKGVQQKIYWDMLILILLGTLGMGARWFFVFSVIYYIYLLLKNKGKMCFPKVWGVKLYLLFILYGSVVGFMLYSVRNVLRDLYYILPTVLWIFIAYHICVRNRDGKKCIITTLSIYGTVVATSCFVKFLFNLSWDFENLRTVFGTGVYEIGFIVPIMVMQSLILKKIMVSKAVDKLMIIIMTLQIILSFGRIAILQPIIMACVLVILLAICKKEHRKIVVRATWIIGSLLIVLLIVYSVMPESVTKTFVDKVLYSAEEVDMSQVISSTSEAMSYWRVYEIQAAQDQWNNSNALVKIFGAGIGKGVSIKYVPYSWDGIVVDKEIPLLHNGFYTLLPKGGVFAFLGLCVLLVGNIIKGVIMSKKSLLNKENGIILVAVSIAAVANTCVVRGPVQQGTFLIWAILIGWINSDRGDNKYENIGCNGNI